jgi:sec-independent protein translocase protein TatB
MLNFGPEKMIVIFFIAMIVLGPDKLPEMARKFGKVMGELRKVSGGFQEEMRRVMDDTTGASGIREIHQDLTKDLKQATSIPTSSGTAPSAAPTTAEPAAPGATPADAAPIADTDR